MPLAASKIKSLKPKFNKKGKLLRETKYKDINNLWKQIYFFDNNKGHT